MKFLTLWNKDVNHRNYKSKATFIQQAESDDLLAPTADACFLNYEAQHVSLKIYHCTCRAQKRKSINFLMSEGCEKPQFQWRL